MPRISSTSCITGTGFMKWNPMNFSGRSVRLASRVIEIDEVFEVRIVSGFRCGSRSSKIACLTVSRSVAASMIRSHWTQIGQLQRRADPRQRRVLFLGGDLLARDLAVEVLVDQRRARSSASWLISVISTS
jgi:hypothetical protein